jgi:hypothetical protein
MQKISQQFAHFLTLTNHSKVKLSGPYLETFKVFHLVTMVVHKKKSKTRYWYIKKYDFFILLKI